LQSGLSFEAIAKEIKWTGFLDELFAQTERAGVSLLFE